MSHRQVQLPLCRACSRFVMPEETDCPFCGENLARAAARHQAWIEGAEKASRDLEEALRQAGYDLSFLPKA